MYLFVQVMQCMVVRLEILFTPREICIAVLPLIQKIGVGINREANSSLFGGGGVDGAINRSGSPAILEECRAIRARQGGCKAGEAVITISGWLPAGYIIHTVGSVWNESHKDKSALLVSCYRNSLRLVE